MKTEANNLENIYVENKTTNSGIKSVNTKDIGLYIDIETVINITGYSRKRIYLYAMRKKMLIGHEGKLLLPLGDVFNYFGDNFKRFTSK